jgi:hypothetical protein
MKTKKQMKQTKKQSIKKSTVKKTRAPVIGIAKASVIEGPDRRSCHSSKEEGPRTPNARYVLVQVDQNLPDPGRAVLDACTNSGLPVLTVWTDPNYIKNLVNR